MIKEMGMDDVIGCNWLLTQLNGLKVEEKENYNSKFLCQNATCRLKNNQENNQKSQKKTHQFFYRKKAKFKIKLKTADLCYASKKPIHNTYIITSSQCFHEKKFKLKIRNRKPLIVHHPKTDRKNNPNP